MSKERIIKKDEKCGFRLKDKCTHFSMVGTTPYRPELKPSGLVETKRGGRECGLKTMYSNVEECVIPGDGRGDVEIKSFRD